MNLLTGSNIKKMFLDETLFENVSFSVESSDKIGFIGANGAGKSTLFKIITGNMDYDSGEIFQSKAAKIGYLDQYAVSDTSKTVTEETLTVFDEIIEIEHRLDEIRFDIENGADGLDALVSEQTRLQERFMELDGAYYKTRAASALKGLGFSEEELTLPVSSLSGGQKTRVALAKILLSDTNLLLLDEPTNHLDITSVEWLEDFLKGYKGAFIVISHDRYFLDKVTNKTFALEGTRFKSYNGGYSAYAEQREVERKTEERGYENTMREIKRLEGVVEQQRRWNQERNYRIIDNKMKSIERLEKSLVQPTQKQEEIRFTFKALPGGGMDVLICDDLSMAFDGTTLFKNADMLIRKGEKVFLLGPNGCGKTTLLKIIMGEYKPTRGECRIGANIEVGYYDQLQENLNMNNTVIDEVWDAYPYLTQTEVRNALAVFLFRGEDVFKDISSLSGGERARVELTKMMLKSVNFLIMDEPTNHLDIASREALENALSDYDGTMLMVSHDRYFINKLADRILYLTPDGIISHKGGYDDFIAETKAVEKAVKPADNAADYKEKKRLEAAKRKTLNDFRKTEDAIAELEAQISEKEAELEKPEVATDYVKAAELTEEIDALNARLEELFADWERLQTEIEENGYE